jgi:hypothetical protein
MLHAPGSPPMDTSRPLSPIELEPPLCPYPIPHCVPPLHQLLPAPRPPFRTNPIPPPTERQHSVGALPTHSGRPNSRSPVRRYHPYQKESPKAEEVQCSAGGTQGGGDPSTVTDTDGWTDADTFLSWEDQANASPPIPGFRLNQGQDFVPCQIKDAQDNLWPAKWTRLDRGDDTYVAGIRANSPNAHSVRLRAMPSHDLTTVPTYLPSDLYFFEIDHPCRFEIDDALVEEGDHTLGAEVRRYRAEHMKMKAALVHEGRTDQVLPCTDRASGFDQVPGGSRCLGAYHEHQWYVDSRCHGAIQRAIQDKRRFGFLCCLRHADLPPKEGVMLRFLTILCLPYGLSLGPSSLLRHHPLHAQTLRILRLLA